MAFVLKDRVKETSTSIGTGPYTVGGAAAGFQSFGSVMSIGDTFWGAIVLSATSWLTGLFTYSNTNQITVTTIYESSNGGSAVSFAAGVKEIYIDLPASRFASAQSTNFTFISTAAQTTFSGVDVNGQTLSYTPTKVRVAVNGIVLLPSSYTASTGTSIVMPSGLGVGDTVFIETVSVIVEQQSVSPGVLYRMSLSTAGSSATMTIAAGYTADSTNLRLIRLSASLAKTTSSFIVGAGGGLDTGTIANNTWYHFYAIMNPVSGAVDVIFSTDASLPSFTLATGFTLYRYIGSGKTNGSAQWIKFFQYGDLFLWDLPVRDVNSVATLTTARILYTLPSVPLGKNVKAKFAVWLYTTGTTSRARFTSPDVVLSENITTFGLGNFYDSTAGSGGVAAMEIMTNISQQIAAKAGAATTSLDIIVDGYYNRRGQDD